eukprot:CCRYP_009561-RA/>CCRYP_009561-RA protein AED:0.42 eAED:0.42 QI:104/1/1/1/0/0/2/2/47
MFCRIGWAPIGSFFFSYCHNSMIERRRSTSHCWSDMSTMEALMAPET